MTSAGNPTITPRCNVRTRCDLPDFSHTTQGCISKNCSCFLTPTENSLCFARILLFPVKVIDTII